MITQAVIMCGGLGTRSGLPYPKALAWLDKENCTLLDHHIKLLLDNGLHRIMVLAGHQGEKVLEHLCSTDNRGAEVDFQLDHFMEGTSCALRQVEHRLDDNFLVLYGDVATNMNLRKLCQYHADKEAVLTSVLHESSHPWDSTHQDTPTTVGGELSDAGIYIIAKACLSLVREGDDISRNLMPKLWAGHHKAIGYATDEFILDTGTPERLAEAQAKL